MTKLLNYFGYYKINKGIKVYTTTTHQLLFNLPDASQEEVLKDVWRTTKSSKTTHSAMLIGLKETQK